MGWVSLVKGIPPSGHDPWRVARTSSEAEQASHPSYRKTYLRILRLLVQRWRIKFEQFRFPIIYTLLSSCPDGIFCHVRDFLGGADMP